MNKEMSEILVRTGPGTPMGNLMRRYWVPVLLSREIAEADGPQQRVQILGEKLLAFRDTAGEVGLIDEFCSHRGTSLYFGRNEENGLRCAYHGLKFNRHGECVDVPSAPQAVQSRVHYVTRASGGNGAVREVCELILSTQGLLDGVIAEYLK